MFLDDISAKEFNEKFPIGTPVVYYPIHPEVGPEGEFHIKTKTRSIAWELGHGEPVVKIEGRTGGVILSHLTLEARDDE